jgi:hypothetical protein
MKYRILFFSLLAVILIVATSCSALPSVGGNAPVAPTAKPPAAIPPTAMPPNQAPATDIPASEIPPTKEVAPTAEVPASPNGVPAGCLDVLTVTKDQLGAKLCMWGIIASTNSGKGDFYLYFEGATKDTLYFMSASWLPTPGVKSPSKGDCVYLENKEVSKFGTNLIAFFTAKELKTCSK